MRAVTEIDSAACELCGTSCALRHVLHVSSADSTSTGNATPAPAIHRPGRSGRALSRRLSAISAITAMKMTVAAPNRTQANCWMTAASAPAGCRTDCSVPFIATSSQPHLNVYRKAAMWRASCSVSPTLGIAVPGLRAGGSSSQATRRGGTLGMPPAI